MPNKNFFSSQFDFLIQNSKDLVVCLSLDGKIIATNLVVENFLGLSKSQLVGESFKLVLNNLNLDILKVSNLNELIPKLPITDLESNSEHHNGHKFDISWSILSLPNRNSQEIVGLILLGKDITELKKLSWQVEKLDNIIKYAPGWIYWKDTNSVHLGCNEQFAIAAGYETRDELIGKTDYQCSWRGNAAKYMQDDQEVIESGKVKLNIEDIVPLKNNKQAIVISNKVPLRDFRTGQVIGVLGISTDITERKKLEEQLQKDMTELKKLSLQIERLDNIIKYAPDMIYWKDVNSVHLGCNEQFAIVAGCEKRDDIVGKSDRDLPWHKQAEKYNLDDKEVIMSGQPRLNIEDIMPFKNGKQAVVITNKVPLRDVRTGQVIGVLGIATDITEQKQLEERLRAANKAKTEFIANMSHDVKTPLSGIIALSQLLNTRVQEEYRDLTQDISQAGQQLMIFFENCMELSRLESNSITLPQENFNLKDLLNEISHLFQPTIKSKSLALYVEYDEQMPQRFLGSRATLYRVILNLLGNAVKFTKKGSITVNVKLGQKSTVERTIVQLIITDTGIGIPKDKQKIIFERFSRLIPSYEGRYEGHGIGLYLVQKFLKKMGGQIIVQSQEGKGSQFIVAVPLQAPLLSDDEYGSEVVFSPKISARLNTKSLVEHVKDSSSVTQKIKSPLTSTNKIKILLVEDNPMAQKAAIILLESLGCEVDLAQCGEEAINLFKPGYYSLVFMDIGLPDMKGYRVAERLRKIEETSFHVPILGLSAHATEEEKRLSNAAGMDEILCKPLLESVAQKVLEQYVSTTQASNTSNLFLTENNLRIIDLSTLPSDLSGKEQAGWEMLAMLIESLPDSRAEIEAAYRKHDLKRLLDQVHKFHGGVCYSKTPHLLKAAQAFEMGLINGETHHLDALYNDLLRSMDLLEKTYSSL